LQVWLSLVVQYNSCYIKYVKVIYGDVSITLNNKPIKQNSIVCYPISMPNIHQLTVRNKSRNPEKIATGFNTEVLIDGQPLKGVKSFSFEVTAKNVGLVKIELYAHVEIDTYTDINIVEQKNRNK